MTTKDEALKLALEALETCYGYRNWEWMDKATAAIREALAEQPAPPPECQTEAEKTAFAFGWWKALEQKRKDEQPAQQPHCNDCGGFDPECPLAQPVQQEIEELTAQRDKLADILTRTANALKGQPAELSLHSWHDLPEVAQQLKAAQQQEPVAWITQNGKGWLRWHKPEDNNTDSVPLYTSPPASKPWVGLTEVAIWNTYKNLWMFHPAEEPRLAGDILKFARAIEAKLREKNA